MTTTFTDWIEHILTVAKVQQKYRDTLLTPASLSYYTTAFTDPSYDTKNNYLFLKILGNISFHKILVWYFSKKFPDVNPKILTQMKINFLRDNRFGEYMLSVFPAIETYITHDPSMKVQLETVEYTVEALLGATELLINKHHKTGFGYLVVNKLCIHFLEEMNIVLDISKLADSKTIINQHYISTGKRLNYVSVYDTEEKHFRVELFVTGLKTPIGKGTGKKKKEGEQNAAADAIQSLGIDPSSGWRGREARRIDPRHFHRADRDGAFNDFITKLLRRVPYISELTLSREDMTDFARAFTNPDVQPDPTQNYELLETLGDNTLNKCVLWYLSYRFPQLNCPEAIDIITKLKISIIESHSFADIATHLGFFPYISYAKPGLNEPVGAVEKRKMLEDVFEAFFAAVELVLDRKVKPGMGFVVCSKLLSMILDERDYSLQYSKLVEPNTRLKELLDVYKDIKVSYKIVPDGTMFKASVLQTRLIEKTPEGEAIYDEHYQYLPFTGRGHSEQEAKQDVSEKVLEYYKSIGISKPIPNDYLVFCH